MIIDVAPETFDAASKVFGQDMAPAVGQTWNKLTAGLNATGGMAGTDNAGGSWAQQYDPAAQGTVGVIADLQNACSQIATLLERTGFNHGLAEARRVAVTAMILIAMSIRLQTGNRFRR